MEKNIAVIKGDGIGPEIVTESMKVLDKVAEKFGHKFNYTQLLMGGCSIDANGVPLTDETIAACKASDAVLSILSAVIRQHRRGISSLQICVPRQVCSV